MFGFDSIFPGFDSIFSGGSVQCKNCNYIMNLQYGSPAPKIVYCPNCWTEITLSPPKEFKPMKYNKNGELILDDPDNMISDKRKEENE